MKAPSARLPAAEELGALAVYHVSPADKQRGAACAGRHLSQGRVAAASSLPRSPPAPGPVCVRPRMRLLGQRRSAKGLEQARASLFPSSNEEKHTFGEENGPVAFFFLL